MYPSQQVCSDDAATSVDRADHHRIKVVDQGNPVCATVTEYCDGR
nr:hypothetical protein [uncultured Bacteroides sp.]